MKIPVIKGRMGSWIYYVGTMTMGQLASNQISASVDEIYKATCLENLLQRNLTNNYESIKEYLLKEKDRFFNAIILAIFDGDPQWLEVEFKGAERDFGNVGFLELTGKEKIFPVDGQHRVKGIKEAVKNNESLMFESVPVIFIAHDNSYDGKKKTRKLFSTLNRRAKPVGQEENIALDEDDICAIITRDLIQNIPLFQGDNLTIKGGKPVSSSNTEAFTSIITLYQCVESIVKWQLKKEGITASKYKEYILYRKDDETIEKYRNIVFAIFDAFIRRTASIQEYLNDNSNQRAVRFRNNNGGVLIFRPVALTEYFNAAIELIISGCNYDEAFEKLNKLPQDITEKPWAGFLWDGTRMRVRISKLVIKDLLVFMSNKELLDYKEYERMIVDYSSALNIDRHQAELIINNLL